jgi:hypothetical protein
VTLPFSEIVAVDDADDGDCVAFTLAQDDIVAFAANPVEGDCPDGFNSFALTIDAYPEGSTATFEALNVGANDGEVDCLELDMILGAGDYLACVRSRFQYDVAVDSYAQTFTGEALGDPLMGACAGSFHADNNSDFDIITDCTSIGGDLYVDNDVTSVGALAGLTSVGDFLWLQSFNLVDADGLASLTDVGALSITGFSIADLSALSNMDVARSTIVSFTDVLQNLEGLSGITAPNSVSIDFNDALTDISGLSGLQSAGLFEATDNAVMTTLGATNLASIGFQLSITDNPLLTSIGLPAVTSIGGDVTITDNPSLPQCEVDAWIAQVQGQGGITGTITTFGNDDVATCD